MRIAHALASAAAIVAVSAACNVVAQTWPAKPVRIVVTFPPGGSSDVVARHIGPLLAERLGQQFIVDNRPGAGATIGAAEVARAAPRRLHADAVEHRADQPVAVHARAFAVRSGEELLRTSRTSARCPTCSSSILRYPAKTIPEFIAWAKQQKDPIPYGSGGIGSIGHIVGELFAKEAGIKLNHIGYKGSSPMHNDLLGGTILFAVDTLPQNVQFQKSGKLRLLAVTSTKRATMAPGRADGRRARLSQLVAENFFGISGPANLPKTVVDPIHKATMSALDDPKLVKSFEDVGIAVRKMSPEEFTAFVQKQVADWAPAVKASGAKLN